uniref:Uncharacterized protein n=1 Tax=Magallana gigas TaxID=29159 RepID=A0A8W8NUI8_MAGGI
MSLSGNSVYPHDVLTVLFCLLTVSQAYVNVALNKPAYQQYPYRGYDPVDARCPATGYFGSNCSVPCTDVNCQYCHIETGTCQGCKPGYKGHRCEIRDLCKTLCPVGNFGQDCSEICINSYTCDGCNDTKVDVNKNQNHTKGVRQLVLFEQQRVFVVLYITGCHSRNVNWNKDLTAKCINRRQLHPNHLQESILYSKN